MDQGVPGAGGGQLYGNGLPEGYWERVKDKYIMELRVYISHLKDEKFDYDIENPKGDSQYAPEPISVWYRIDELYWDIVHKVLDHNENTKQTDWGTFVIKLTNINLIQFLSNYISYYEKFNNEKYKNPDWKTTSSLLNLAEKLPDGEYLLVGQELS
jgi:hypothetical protein